MFDPRRHSRPRPKPEVFGLSTLDTVTCALGGAIVLLILMASLTDPRARVQLVEHRRTNGSGAGAASSQQGADTAIGAQGGEVENLAVLFIEYSNVPAGGMSLQANSNGCGGVRLRTMRGAAAHYAREPADGQFAVAAWNDGTAGACSAFSIQLRPLPIATQCTATLVSAAHFQSVQSGVCPDKLQLVSNDGRVFRLKR